MLDGETFEQPRLVDSHCMSFSEHLGQTNVECIFELDVRLRNSVDQKELHDVNRNRFMNRWFGLLGLVLEGSWKKSKVQEP